MSCLKHSLRITKENDSDNILYGTHLFHTYVDGDARRRPKDEPASWGRSPELWIEYLFHGELSKSSIPPN